MADRRGFTLIEPGVAPMVGGVLGRGATPMGFALPVAVFAMVMVGILLTGGVHLATQRTPIGTATEAGSAPIQGEDRNPDRWGVGLCSEPLPTRPGAEPDRPARAVESGGCDPGLLPIHGGLGGGEGPP